MAYEFISRSELSARVAAVCATATKAQAEIHACAVSGLEHTRVHGDYTSMEALLNGLPRGTRVKALAYWFKHFSNGKLTFKIDDKSKAWVGNLSKDRDNSDFKIDEAIATTFADLTNEKSVESVTVESLLKALRNKATNTDYFEGTTIPKVTVEARIAASKLIAFAIEQGMDVKAA